MTLRVKFTRIKYKGKADDKMQESAILYYHPTNGAKYKIVLNNVDNTFAIFDVNAENMPPVKTGKGVNRLKNMMAARDALETFGFEFTREPRGPRPRKPKTEV